MIYLRRKIDAFLDKWHRDEKKKPLIVKGARQIGKTRSIGTLPRHIMKM